MSGAICFLKNELFSSHRGLPGRGPKSLKACNTKLGSVCKCFFLKWNLKETSSFKGGSGGSSPRNFLASGVENDAFQCHFRSLYSNTPTLSPQKKFSSDLHWSQEWSRWAPKSLKSLKKAEPCWFNILFYLGLSKYPMYHKSKQPR